MNQPRYAVLARLSASCPPLKGRLPTRYSPVRHFTRPRRDFLVRLACVKHAASVRSEPGSNSPLEKLYATGLRKSRQPAYFAFQKGSKVFWGHGYAYNVSIAYARFTCRRCTFLKFQRAAFPVTKFYGHQLSADARSSSLPFATGTLRLCRPRVRSS
jgi:hypothetical protein